MYIHEGVIINWKQVQYVRPLGREASQADRPSAWRYRVVFVGEDNYMDITTSGDPEEFLESRQVVPAQPDFFVVQPIHPDLTEWHLSPVVAWRIHDHYADPICLDGDDPEHAGVMQPDGKVIESGTWTHANIHDYMDQIRAREAERAAKKLAATADTSA